MFKDSFYSEMLRRLFDCLTTYDITKDTDDFLPFLEWGKEYYLKISSKAPGLSTKETAFINNYRLLETAYKTGFLSLSIKGAMAAYLEQLANGFSL